MEKTLFTIFYIASYFNLFLSQQIQTPYADDQSILLTLKSTISSDPTKFLSNWSPNVSICNWAGISCTNNKRVMAINLSSSNLEGTITPHLKNLRFLISFDISFNSFNGFIPTELGSLTALNYVNLAYNNFTGEIPASVGNLSQLQHLLLQNNSLSGSIPTSLGDLSKLKTLDLAYNFLDGNIPQQFRNLSNLKILSLEDNQLSGELPYEIFNNMSFLQEINFAYNQLSGSLPLDMCKYLVNLKGLDMSFNQFEGPIPPELYKCKDLESILLSYNNFNTLPKEIGYLSNLKDLIIGGNFFTRGGIPLEIGNLTQLKKLDIHSSYLTGQIPSSIFNISSLTLLNLGNNSLSGSLPTFPHFNLPALQVFNLATNNITGHIPKQVGNLTSLQSLYLAFNKLTGKLPLEIASLGSLQYFEASYNSLQGFIPPGVFNMSSLVIIALDGNNFSGRLPSNMWTTLPNIEYVNLNSNDITGTIPSSISNATKLVMLSIDDASLSGTIPITIGDLQFLKGLFLGGNNLTGESWTRELRFITALTRCRNLERVELSLNQFNGYLPTSIGNLSSSLRLFNIFDSKLIGRIPNEIGNMSGLQSINMDNNEFTGFIPSTIGKMTRLDRIYLEHNRLEGSIPNELCELENLGDLYLNENMLTGSIPDCLGEIKSMRRLYLHSNNLSSTIPTSIWSLNFLLDLNLSVNGLTGNIPLQVQNLKVITALDLSWNQLSGEVPSLIGSAQSLVRLSLAHNKFQGNIPQSFGNLLSLETLDLSGNHFSGTIPKSLEDLKYLNFFNVSSNELEGQIPTRGSFVNFTVQSFLDNSDLCGSDRLHFPPCKLAKNGRSRLKVLKYFIVPSVVVVLIAASIAYLCIRSKKEHVKVQRGEFSFPSNLKQVLSFYEVSRATYSFSESCLLGAGSFGSVYKATLVDGSIVAVKVFNMQCEAFEKSFDAECTVLGSIRHRNLVKILGCCSNLDFKALILEYKPNGNLDMWLNSEDRYLDLVERLNIAVDIAAALEYLHHDLTSAIVHCDLKPSNILLDDDKVAYLCDFGIAKLFNEGESMKQTKTLGTIGYMAPEYGAGGIVSTSGDVYSYGVILLQMFTNKSPTDDIFEHGLSLKGWVAKSIAENSILQVVDTRLISGKENVHLSAKVNCFISLLQLAMECLPNSPQKRINMREITVRVQKIRAMLLSRYTNPQ